MDSQDLGRIKKLVTFSSMSERDLDEAMKNAEVI